MLRFLGVELLENSEVVSLVIVFLDLVLIPLGELKELLPLDLRIEQFDMLWVLLQTLSRWVDVAF